MPSAYRHVYFKTTAEGRLQSAHQSRSPQFHQLLATSSHYQTMLTCSLSCISAMHIPIHSRMPILDIALPTCPAFCSARASIKLAKCAWMVRASAGAASPRRRAFVPERCRRVSRCATARARSRSGVAPSAHTQPHTVEEKHECIFLSVARALKDPVILPQLSYMLVVQVKIHIYR